jgi:hypothetical protein
VAIVLSVLLVRRIRQKRASIAVKAEENDTLQPLMSQVGHNTGPFPSAD